MEEDAGADRSTRATWTTVLLAGTAFVFGALQGGAAAASPNNCGELPGIATLGAMVVAIGIAVVIALAGSIVAVVGKSGTLFGAAVVIALAVVLGTVIGSGLAQPYPCP